MENNKNNTIFSDENYPYPEEIVAQLSSIVETLSILKDEGHHLSCTEKLSMVGNAINELNITAKQIILNHFNLCFLNEKKTTKFKLDSSSRIIDVIALFCS